ncbi:MAG: TolC family protein [Prevotella sp.]|nr:TolC family protein [Prevotella sp.]
MRKYIIFILLSIVTTAEAKRWTLNECIDYAIANNISLRKTSLQRMSATEDILQSQANLFPTLNGSTSHNVTYRPWPQNGQESVQNGYVVSSVDKVYYNGSYGVNLNWTVWNGGINKNTVRLNRLTEQQAELDSAITANSIQEQILQLYVQIVYSTEAIKVFEKNLETSRYNEERGKAMVENKLMSKADLSQLTSQRAQDEYSIVESQSNLRGYKRQLKQLLQIVDDEDFDVVTPETTDEMALQPIPTISDVYISSLNNRPEIENAKVGIESSNLSIKMAKAQRLPTLGLNATFGTNTTSMNSNAWGTQLKNNFALGAGLTLSIPIFDGRKTKTAVNKALIQREQYLLSLEEKQTELHSTIENYWLQATNNQSKFIAAKEVTKSAQESYDMLSGKYKESIINIVELMTGRDKLLSAQQNELQSKFLTILNIEMLEFYKNGTLKN